jgi:hypothetical protein
MIESIHHMRAAMNMMRRIFAILGMSEHDSDNGVGRTEAVRNESAPRVGAGEVVIDRDDGLHHGPEDVLDITVWKNADLSRDGASSP